jgi:hypothetical protein
VKQNKAHLIHQTDFSETLKTAKTRNGKKARKTRKKMRKALALRPVCLQPVSRSAVSWDRGLGVREEGPPVLDCRIP